MANREIRHVRVNGESMVSIEEPSNIKVLLVPIKIMARPLLRRSWRELLR